MVDNTTLSEEEAKEFHQVFSSSASGFILVAVIAHVLAWFYRPWLFSEETAKAAMDTIHQSLTFLS